MQSAALAVLLTVAQLVGGNGATLAGDTAPAGHRAWAGSGAVGRLRSSTGSGSGSGSGSSSTSHGQRRLRVGAGAADRSAKPASARARGATASGMDALMACINGHQAPAAVTTWRSAQALQRTAIPVAAAWLSARPPAQQVTLAVGLTLDATRTQQLLAICRHWPGPVSAVVHLPLAAEAGATPSLVLGEAHKRQLSSAAANLSLVHAAAERRPCQLDLMLSYELYDPCDDGASGTLPAGGANSCGAASGGDGCCGGSAAAQSVADMAALLFPISTLRNYARLQARTPLVGMFGVDLLPSATLTLALLPSATTTTTTLAHLPLAASQPPASSLGSAAAGAAAELQAAAALVVPAFAVSSAARGLRAVRLAGRLARAASKAELLPLFNSAAIQQLDATGVADYQRWFAAGEVYEAAYAPGYEPFLIVSRRGAPFSDARIRGGAGGGDGGGSLPALDRAAYAAYLNASGYRLLVHPDAYLVHRQHPDSAATLAFVEGAAKARRQLVEQLKQQKRRELRLSALGAGAGGPDSRPSSPEHGSLPSGRPPARRTAPGRPPPGPPPGGLYGLSSAAYDAMKQLVASDAYEPLPDPAALACSQELEWWQ